MYEYDPHDYMHIRKGNRHSQMQLKQTAIVFALIIFSVLISILLPIYFVSLSAAGG